jgi:hypothetical protein
VPRDRESKGGNKGISKISDMMLARRGALRAAACASGIRVAQFCSGHDVQPANWEVSVGRARKQSDSSSLGVFLSPRLTRRGIVVMKFLGRLDIGLQKPK